MFYRFIFGLRRWNTVPDGYSANSVPPGHADDLFGGEIGMASSIPLRLLSKTARMLRPRGCG